MFATTPQGLRRLRTFGFTAGVALVLSVGAVAPALASPITDECSSGDLSEVCLSNGQSLSMDDSNVIPGVDEIVSSPNMRLVKNLPKQGTFAEATNSDIAFQGRYAFAGNYNGFMIYDISNPRNPTVVSQVQCPGSQNDISVFGDLLFLSTDSSRTDDSCASTGQTAENPLSWEGMKIFDISNKSAPRYIKSIETKCGSHTHTLVPAHRSVYIYVSSYGPSDAFPDCKPPHDLISIIKVPLADPTGAALIATPVLFPTDGGNPGGNGSSTTSGCHDLTAYPAKKLMAGACMGDGLLIDIRNPEVPRVITSVRDTVNFAFWHSATFNQAGTKVVFTDELGGGTQAMCNPTVGPTRGANGIYDIVGHGDNRRLEFRSYYKIPRTNSNTENCVAHNGSIVPVIFGDVMVQAWYQGGVSVFDFSNSRNPREIAWWERGPISNETLVGGGSWSAYWYNGYIFSNDIAKGLDVLEVTDWRVFTAKLNRISELNAQTQPTYWW
jgi:hypothetical protein